MTPEELSLLRDDLLRLARTASADRDDVLSRLSHLLKEFERSQLVVDADARSRVSTMLEELRVLPFASVRYECAFGFSTVLGDEKATVRAVRSWIIETPDVTAIDVALVRTECVLDDDESARTELRRRAVWCLRTLLRNGDASISTVQLITDALQYPDVCAHMVQWLDLLRAQKDFDYFSDPLLREVDELVARAMEIQSSP